MIAPFFKVLVCLLATLILPAIGLTADEDIEEIVVTGSHIKGSHADESLPVTSLSRDDLAYEGSPTIIELIKNLSFSQGADGETDFFQAGAGPDRATANLRGIGPSRTLVLINGRRSTWSPHAISAQAQLLVDVNMLPSVALERVEILREGAASTYGSDAIARVMNYITRSDFSGMEVSADYKGIDGSAGDTEAGIILGTGLLQNRAHAVSSFSIYETQPTRTRQTRLGRVALRGESLRRLVQYRQARGHGAAGLLEGRARRWFHGDAGQRHRRSQL